MDIQTFDFALPEELIAQRPLVQRSASRLLVVGSEQSDQDADRQVSDVVDYVRRGDLVVLNDTRVIPARLFAKKPTGGRVEVFLERILSPGRALCQLRASGKLGPGSELLIDAGQSDTGQALIVEGRRGRFYELSSTTDLLSLFDKFGTTPLPPYIDRPADDDDLERYQTVFARQPGAVAAPTAGLHLDENLLAQLTSKGCAVGYLTLHVGAGTFAPVRDGNIDDHALHYERIEVGASLCEMIMQTKRQRGRIFAVGTTVVRALESAALHCRLADSPGAAEHDLISPLSGETDLFIRPGFKFQIVDMLLTNFHLPKSTLLMLVSAFAGTERIMSSYREAVRRRYRFYSYGDAMLVHRDGTAHAI